MTDTRNSQPTQLEAELLDIGRKIAFPSTPNIAAQVGSRLREQPTPIRSVTAAPTHTQRWSRPAAAAVIVVLITAIVLVPGTRTTIAERLGLRGVEILTTPTVSLPTPGPAMQSLRLGEQRSLAVAVEQLDYQPFLPPVSLASPDRVYVLEPPLGGQISYVYLPSASLPEAPETGVGLLVSQFQGDTNESFISKQLAENTDLTVVDVNGLPGFWLSGAPHVFAYEDDNGEFQQETVRLAANVLIWEADGLTLRIESALPLESVLAIAESMTR